MQGRLIILMAVVPIIFITYIGVNLLAAWMKIGKKGYWMISSVYFVITLCVCLYYGNGDIHLLVKSVVNPQGEMTMYYNDDTRVDIELPGNSVRTYRTGRNFYYYTRMNPKEVEEDMREILSRMVNDKEIIRYSFDEEDKKFAVMIDEEHAFYMEMDRSDKSEYCIWRE